MGKTAQGAVWLNAERLGAFDYWQFWRNTDDADVGRFLRLFTELPLDEIARLEALQGAEINEAKKVLAFEATPLCHGAAAAQRRRGDRAARVRGRASARLPSAEMTGPSSPAVRRLRALAPAGLAASNSEARRLIRGGGRRQRPY